MDDKYITEMAGARMGQGLAGQGYPLAQKWLVKACKDGTTPVSRFLEDRQPVGELGRLAEMQCGLTIVKV